MGSYCFNCKNKTCPNTGLNMYIGWDCLKKEEIKKLETEDEIMEELWRVYAELDARNHGNSGIHFDSNLDYVHVCEWGKELFDRLAHGEKN